MKEQREKRAAERAVQQEFWKEVAAQQKASMTKRKGDEEEVS